ncbi:MAG TPA: DUF6498-containing protein [Nannocystis sp.]
MSSAQPEPPHRSAARPWWQPLVTLAISLYGIVVDGWGMQAVIFLFWWEILLILGAALVRVLFAFDGKPGLATVGVKLGTLAFGVVMDGAMLMLSVVFSIEGILGAGESDGSVVEVGREGQLLLASYALGLVFHYFLNGRFRAANPPGELFASLFHVLFVLVVLMPITMHLLPSYPHLDRARWVAVTVVIAKFLGDLLFARRREWFAEFMAI